MSNEEIEAFSERKGSLGLLMEAENLDVEFSVSVPPSWEIKASPDKIVFSSAAEGVKTAMHLSHPEGDLCFLSVKAGSFSREIRAIDWLIVYLASCEYTILDMKILSELDAEAEVFFKSTSPSSYGIPYKGFVKASIRGLVAVCCLSAYRCGNEEKMKTVCAQVIESFIVEIPDQSGLERCLNSVRKQGNLSLPMSGTFQYPASWAVEEKDPSGGYSLYNLDNDGDAIGMARISVDSGESFFEKAAMESKRLGFSIPTKIPKDLSSDYEGFSVTQSSNGGFVERELWITRKSGFFISLLTPKSKDSVIVKALNVRGLDIVSSTL